MIAEALRARLDHVAVAVGDLDDALAYWCGTVGAGVVAREINDGFDIAQVRTRGGGKLELIAPPPGGDGGFILDFLARFGPTIHHVTLKVADLGAAIDTVRAGGYDVVDVQTMSRWWREGFLRPTQVGGLIVQVAWTPEDDRSWARRIGTAATAPTSGAPRLLGATLEHPDLAAARALWSLLGAEIEGGHDRFVCRWPDSTLDVVVRHGDHAGPVALRFEGALVDAPEGFGVPPLDVG
ncbi:MAG TPA: VOC family protein [Euzebyales bacterium]|nr:VOC family protein [Euzebyales bacterium]